MWSFAQGRVTRCVCVRERERDTGSHHSGVSCLNRGLCANAYEQGLKLTLAKRQMRVKIDVGE